jgi:superfamily II DNA or RNA helicase
MSQAPIKISFHDGTLLLTAPVDSELPLADYCRYDERVHAWRSEAMNYAPLLRMLHTRRIPYDDQARVYEKLQLPARSGPPPRDYQHEALRAWVQADCRGVVVLPTGTGKSLVAQLAIARASRTTLVVVPTLDLMEQWASQLATAFGQEIGLLGGGSKEIRQLTVSTYDSAAMMMEFIGGRFGLLVVDECHHLPGPAYQLLARFAIAPFRLGLTATPERQDDGEALLGELLGPLCFRRDIDEMEGAVLAPYRTEQLGVMLDPDEAAEYAATRAVYIDFLRAQRINLGSSRGWSNFLIACARQNGGREALRAFMRQRQIARAGRAKLRQVWQLLQDHAGERILVFTADNQTAYEIGERFVLPVITHHTKIAERRELLAAFRAGELPVLVTSKVLNEGVDVPEASVGIVVSGSGSIREHVQRLGRILRPVAGKQAVLYELISADTAEYHVSNRRRQHRAYERPDSLSP